MNNKKKINKTGTVAGTYSAIITIVVIAVAIVVNLIVNSLPSKYLKLDTSADSMFTFDEKTEAFIAGVSEQVNIYHIVTKGSEDPYITEILDRYADMNKNLKVKQIDLASNPTFAEKYTEEAVSDNSIIVENADRYKVIPATDIYYYYSDTVGMKMDYYTLEYAYQYYYQNYGIQLEFSQIFAGESAVASAIDFVTKTDVPKLYFLSGHGEPSLNRSLTEWLELQNYETETLTLSSDGELSDELGFEVTETEAKAVPEDADAVVITGLTRDISESERASLEDYVGAGGELLIMSYYTMTGLPNFTALCETYGMNINMSLVVEGDSSYYYDTPVTIKAQTGGDDITSGISNIYVKYAQGMKLAESMPEGMSAATLLSTSDKGFAKKVGFNTQSTSWKNQEEGDEAGPILLAAQVELEGAGSVTWFGSNYYMIQSTSIGTGLCEVFKAAVTDACGTVDTVSVHTIELSMDYLTVPEGSAGFWGVMIIGVIPLAFIGGGLAVWMRRRTS